MALNEADPGDVSSPRKSRRIAGTDAPCIVKMQKMLRGRTGLRSLAQGIVHWSPPRAALQVAKDAVEERDVSQYGADEGDVKLRAALTAKLATTNNLDHQSVFVTAGANQAFANLVVGLCDAGDRAVLFAPYYFNHMMALQMSSVSPLVGPCTADMLPDVAWLKEQMASRSDIRMVVICNPCNPTGALASRSLMDEASKICRENSCWLVVDNTYEDFVYSTELDTEEAPCSIDKSNASLEGHSCVGGRHVVNVFSFSKAYGMMGWRMGYLAFDDRGSLGEQLVKAQDTLVICPPRLNQRVALAALELAGPKWVAGQIAESLVVNRRALASVIIRSLGRKAILGSPRGAIYLMVTMPAHAGCLNGVADDVAAVEYLADNHGVVTIPGSACGAPGCIRICFANLEPDACREAAARLEMGLVELRNQPRPHIEMTH